MKQPFNRAFGADVIRAYTKDLTEERMQDSIVAYLKAKYPKIRFISTLNGEHNRSRKTRSRNSKIQWGAGVPDMFIFAKRGAYCGLVLELKKAAASPFRKDGKLKAGKHLKQQEGWLEYFRSIGYKAVFAVGLDQTKVIIDNYLNNNK